MNTKQQGFTLIELVVVIVILGILAAVAVPRLVNMQGDARFSVLRGVEASMRSASAMIHAKSLATGTANGNLPVGSVEGVNAVIAVVNSYPATGAMTQLLDLQGNNTFTVTAATGTVQITGATTPGNCQVVYTQAAAGGVPTINNNGSATRCN